MRQLCADIIMFLFVQVCVQYCIDVLVEKKYIKLN